VITQTSQTLGKFYAMSRSVGRLFAPIGVQARSENFESVLWTYRRRVTVNSRCASYQAFRQELTC
jgi:hypothetical protein